MGAPHVLIVRTPDGRLTWLQALASRRKGDVAAGIPAAFTGLLMTDGYTGYQHLLSRLAGIQQCCQQGARSHDPLQAEMTGRQQPEGRRSPLGRHHRYSYPGSLAFMRKRLGRGNSGPPRWHESHKWEPTCSEGPRTQRDLVRMFVQVKCSPFDSVRRQQTPGTALDFPDTKRSPVQIQYGPPVFQNLIYR